MTYEYTCCFATTRRLTPTLVTQEAGRPREKHAPSARELWSHTSLRPRRIPSHLFHEHVYILHGTAEALARENFNELPNKCVTTTRLRRSGLPWSWRGGDGPLAGSPPPRTSALRPPAATTRPSSMIQAFENGLGRTS